MRAPIRLTLAAAVLAPVLLAASACSSSGGGGKSGSIVIGSVNSLSGQVTFPEASQAAKAVFDRVNASGGINGKKIDYRPLDDKGDPSSAAQAARKLAGSGAVALAGSGSLLDCEVNAAFYKQSGLSSIPGVGVDPGCFASPSIAPVNVGPYLGTQAALQFGSEQLGLKRICAFFSIIAGTGPAYRTAVSNWSKSTGKKLALDDTSLPPTTTDFTPYLVHANHVHCDGIFVNAVEPAAVTLAKDMAAQNVTNMTLLTLSSVYTAQAAKAIGSPGFPFYSASEFAPYTDASSTENKDWRTLMESKHIPLTSFAQGGYLAATYLTSVLKSIKGSITRGSVTNALHSMKPIDNPMTGSAWVFGKAATHNPNRSVKIVQLASGAWTVKQQSWVTVQSS